MSIQDKQAVSVTTGSLKPVILSTTIGAIISLGLAAYGSLQKYEVYIKPTGLHFPPYTYVIQREFAKKREPTFLLPKVAYVEKSATLFKVGFGVAALLLAGISYWASDREEELKELRQYETISNLTKAKIDIDHSTAVHNKLASERSLVTAATLMTELMQNPTYRKLKQSQVNAEEGVAEEDEEEEPTWNPFVDGNEEIQDSTGNVTPKQLEGIKARYSKGDTLQMAVESELRIHRSHPQYKTIIKEVVIKLRSGR
ncbi:MAG: hypothetical protein NHB32_08420 [Fischerella sp. CENA71]|nr:hypothetical protein [Fischerella sp. CENA71]